MLVLHRGTRIEDSHGEAIVTRRLISSGSSFEREIGYSRAVADGDWIFVSGTTAFDYRTMTIAPGIVAQAEQCFRNIDEALRQAGASLADVVRVMYIVPDAAGVSEVLADSPGALRREAAGGDDDFRRVDGSPDGD